MSMGTSRWTAGQRRRLRKAAAFFRVQSRCRALELWTASGKGEPRTGGQTEMTSPWREAMAPDVGPPPRPQPIRSPGWFGGPRRGAKTPFTPARSALWIIITIAPHRTSIEGL
jgi:hypothetical protein